MIRRSGPNAFAYTQLLRILRKHGVTELVIVGGDVRQSISGTTREAAGHGFEVSIPKQLTFPAADSYLDLLRSRADIL